MSLSTARLPERIDSCTSLQARFWDQHSQALAPRRWLHSLASAFSPPRLALPAETTYTSAFNATPISCPIQSRGTSPLGYPLPQNASNLARGRIVPRPVRAILWCRLPCRKGKTSGAWWFSQRVLTSVPTTTGWSGNCRAVHYTTRTRLILLPVLPMHRPAD